MASLGAKMHARSVELAKRYQVPLRISSSFNDVQGTWISLQAQENLMEKTLIQSIATHQGYSFFSSKSMVKDLMDAFEKNRIPLRFVSVSGEQLSFLCPSERALTAKKIFDEKKVQYREVEDVAIVSLVGHGLTNSSECFCDIFRILEAAQCECHLIASNTLSITVGIPNDRKKEIAIQFHDQFIGQAEKEMGPPRKEAPPILGGESLLT